MAEPQTRRGEALVAILNNWSDWLLLEKELWYRIPVKKAPRRWPPQPVSPPQTPAPSKPAEQSVIPLQWNTLNNDDRIFVPIQLNKDLWRSFLLDTGAPNTEMDVFVARQLKLTIQKTPPQNGYQAEYVRCAALLSQAFAPVPNLPFVLTNMELIRNSMPNLAGTLGMNLLQSYALSLDFDAHRVQLLYPGSPAGSSYVPKNAQSVPLTPRDGHFYVQTLLDDQPVEFAVDTGSYRTAFFDRAMLRVLKPQAIVDGPGASVTEKGGKKLRYVGTKLLQMRTLRIGTFAVKEPEVMVTEREKGVTLNLLGLSVLEHFQVVLDFPGKVMYLAPRQQMTENLREWNFVGLQIQQDQEHRWTVSKVDKDTPAVRAGFQAGDEVQEVAGQRATLLSKEFIADLLLDTRLYDQELRGKAMHKGEQSAYTFHLRFKKSDPGSAP